MQSGYRLLQLYEIQTFYHTVLKIKDSELTSIPWKEVVQRICKQQPHVHLVVNQGLLINFKKTLTLKKI